MVVLQHEGKHITTATELKDIMGDYPPTILKQMANVVNRITNANSHFVYLHPVGSQVSQTITELQDTYNYSVVVPEIQKYRDSTAFNSFIKNTLV